MATKRPLSSDFDDVPRDQKRFCSEGTPSMPVLSPESTLPLPPMTTAPGVCPVSFPVTASKPFSIPLHLASVSGPTTNVNNNIVQALPPSLNTSVQFMPTIHAGTVAMQQRSDPIQSPDSASSSVLVLTSSPPLLHSPSSKLSTAVSLSSSVPMLSGANSGNRQPICSVDAKPAFLKGQTSAKNMRFKILKNKKAKLTAIKLKYDSLLREKFFLGNGGNLMEFLSWRKKPNVLREDFVKHFSLDIQPHGGTPLLSASTGSIITTTLKSSEATMSLTVTSISSESVRPVNEKHLSKSPQAMESRTTKPMLLDVSNGPPSATTIQIPLSTVSPGLHVTPPKGAIPISPSRSISFPSSSPRPATRAHASFSSVYENSHEDIVMRARQEAEVMKSISELRREGLWSASRVPKVQEPVRIKTHWDYLLEEMQWLATDFGNEKRWKINAARKVYILITCDRVVYGEFFDELCYELKASEKNGMRVN